MCRKNKNLKLRLNSGGNNKRNGLFFNGIGKLEELFLFVFNKFILFNIKKMGSEFMKEWEWSLSLFE